MYFVSRPVVYHGIYPILSEVFSHQLQQQLLSPNQIMQPIKQPVRQAILLLLGLQVLCHIPCHTIHLITTLHPHKPVLEAITSQTCLHGAVRVVAEEVPLEQQPIWECMDSRLR